MEPRAASTKSTLSMVSIVSTPSITLEELRP